MLIDKKCMAITHDAIHTELNFIESGTKGGGQSCHTRWRLLPSGHLPASSGLHHHRVRRETGRC